MAITVIGLFDTPDEARRSVQDLLEHRFPRDQISLIAGPGHNDELPGEPRSDTGDRIVEGVGAGAAIGGIGGLLLGLAALAIPGVGAVVAAGPIVAALGGAGLGAIAGGLIGTLTGIGVPETHAAHYAEALRRGGTLVLVKSAATTAGAAAEILSRHGAADIEKRVAQADAQAWNGAVGMPRAMTPSLASTLGTDADLTSSTTTESLPLTLGNNAGHASLDASGDGAAPKTGITITDAQFEILCKGLSNPPGAATGHEADFRSDFQARYSDKGLTFEQLVPAYRYGYHLGLNPRYRNSRWAQAEAYARADWESRHGAWEQYKEAVHCGWNCAHGPGNGGRRKDSSTANP